MSNNLVVDVASINNAINTVNLLYNEAGKNKHWIQGNWAAPLQIHNEVRDLRIEAAAISFTSAWSGLGTSTVRIAYQFKNTFAIFPIVSVTYDGAVTGVVTRIQFLTDKAHPKGYLDVFVTKPGGAKWDAKSDKFSVHLIAIGY